MAGPAPPASASQDELNAILRDALPRQGAWSDEEYLWLTDRSRRLIEFTDGYLQELPWPTFSHQAILAFLYRSFHAWVGPRGGVVVFSALRLRVREGMFREPDLRGEGCLRSQGWRSGSEVQFPRSLGTAVSGRGSSTSGALARHSRNPDASCASSLHPSRSSESPLARAPRPHRGPRGSRSRPRTAPRPVPTPSGRSTGARIVFTLGELRAGRPPRVLSEHIVQ